MAHGYVVVDVDITHMEAFKNYMAEAPAAIQAFGGEYLARGGRLEVLEGEWTPPRMTLLRFPSFDAARQWYDAEQYRQARAKRAGATAHFNMVLVEGLDTPV